MKGIFRNKIVLHILFWCFYFVFYFLTFRAKAEPVKLALITAAVSLPYQLFFTYSQISFLIPRFLIKRKHLAYILLTLLFAKIACNIAILTYQSIVIPMETGKPANIPWHWLYTINLRHVLPLFSMLTICGIAVAIKLLKRYYLENDRNQKIEQEKTLMELEMLKAQVHPHFLFNTLNNLYSLTLTGSNDAPIVVTHLSGLLRYMLYECNEKEVPLNNEIAALKKYVELEKLRYGNRLDVSFSCSGQTNGQTIAPLLLLPFVENSFKHGASQQLDQCWVNLHLHVDNHAFSFNLSNSCSKERLPAINGGIGLQNIQKRLDLIYAGAYNLVITQQEEMYAVKLTVQLNIVQKLAASNETPFVNPLPVAAV
ncbi:MAG TPA: sensor histidine kinase [Ferruginibacter sp.]|nr:sensor histidine kinase [Ferruginibacter sp.]